MKMHDRCLFLCTLSVINYVKCAIFQYGDIQGNRRERVNPSQKLNHMFTILKNISKAKHGTYRVQHLFFVHVERLRDKRCQEIK